MGEKFTKRIQKWGLLRRVAKPGKPWDFVCYARYLFDSELEAHRRASEMNGLEAEVEHSLGYLYKPVEVYLEVEIDKALGGE